MVSPAELRGPYIGGHQFEGKQVEAKVLWTLHLHGAGDVAAAMASPGVVLFGSGRGHRVDDTAAYHIGASFNKDPSAHSCSTTTECSGSAARRTARVMANSA